MEIDKGIAAVLLVGLSVIIFLGFIKIWMQITKGKGVPKMKNIPPPPKKSNKEVLQELQKVRESIYWAWKDNDHILIGSAINDLDTFIYKYQDKLKQ